MAEPGDDQPVDALQAFGAGGAFRCAIVAEYVRLDLARCCFAGLMPVSFSMPQVARQLSEGQKPRYLPLQ